MTACSSSCQYPATSHSRWRGVDQHSTGHNQQPDQLYAKEMCCTEWSKWWSHQILTDFLTPPNKAKLDILEWPFIVASLRHTCAIFMLSNQHLDMPHLLGGMDYLDRGEVLTNTDLDRSVNSIWEKWFFCVHKKNVLDFWVQLMKNRNSDYLSYTLEHQICFITDLIGSDVNACSLKHILLS